MSNGSRKNSSNESIGINQPQRRWRSRMFDLLFPFSLTVMAIEGARLFGIIDKNQLDLGIADFASRLLNL